MKAINAIITQLRVPGLPYPVGRLESSQENDWSQFLASAWMHQMDFAVIDLLKAEESIRWSTAQVNAGYLADRIMDLFLRHSGLHPSLVTRVARLRFFLAWDLHRRDQQAVAEQAPLREWLDSLHGLKGWSETGGRADRQVLNQLGLLQEAVSEAFNAHDDAPVNRFFAHWLEQTDSQHRRAETLQSRLLQTEQGAATQRAAENAAQAALGRALQGRQLPGQVHRFLQEDWCRVLRQSVRTGGVGGKPWRHGNRLLEWLVWVADPALSRDSRDRLYQVGEQLVDKMRGLVNDLWPHNPPVMDFSPVEELLLIRLKGETPVLEKIPAIVSDQRWLEPPDDLTEAPQWQGQWYLYREGDREIRQFFFCTLPDTGEVLWTNGFGVKLDVQPFLQVQQALKDGHLRCLPPLQSFAAVLDKTLSGLEQLLAVQQQRRQHAMEQARDEARALRLAQQQQAAAEQQRLADERELAEAAARRAADDAKEQALLAKQAQERQHHETLLALVDAVHLGGWVEPGTGGEKTRRLKLALRIKASGKLVFVDRLGLNRETLNRFDLAGLLLNGQARILDQGAEFEDTLSRVVGRIRVGR
ncbi:MAG: DUF1631 family protein [Halomonadaceae bacterium]|nr:MAG: DUF1631 family protein [Halomonadaceae bacterium]